MQRIGRASERLKELRQRVRQRRDGEVVVDGRRLVEDLVRWGVAVDELYLSTSEAHAPGAEALHLAAVRVWEVEDSVLAAAAPTRHPQGVLAVVSEPVPPPWLATHGIALYLDRIQDPGNLGAIVRAAAGLGAAAVLLGPGCADPFHPAAVRGSAAAVFRIPVHRGALLGETAATIRGQGGSVWAAEADGLPVTEWRPDEPALLLLGAEGSGLGPEALAFADGCVSVPLANQVESLNVAVAAGILLHAFSNCWPCTVPP